MRISGFFVRNWQFTVVLFLMLVAVGGNAWVSIPRAEDPSVAFPSYTVVAIYPGASPKDLEEEVVDPVEKRLHALEDVKEIKSHMSDGLAVVDVQFQPDADVDRKYDEVVREVNALRPELPQDLQSLDVIRHRSSDVAIVQLALVSPVAPYHELQRWGEELRDRIETVPGVRRAQVWAYPERQVVVTPDLGRLARLGIPPSRLLAAIGSDNANIPGGTVEIGTRRFSVKTGGSFGSLDEIRGTVLTAADGRLVRLGDVADVEWGYADPTHVGRFNGQRAVFVTATQEDGQNIARVREGIYRELDAFERRLPARIRLERGFDQSANVRERLSHLGRDFALAIVLVLVTLLPLGVRASAIVMVSIPLSLAVGLAALAATGYSINQLSIIGFVIALGLLVDDSVVVVENIARFLRAGHSRREAAILGTRQIAVAVLGCTATLVLAFVPLVFLPGLPGKFIRVMPLTVIYTILASLAIALTIIPWLAGLLLKEERDHRGNVFMRALTWAIHRSYAPLLHRALQRPRPVLAISGALVVASALLLPVVGFSLFPKAETPQFVVDIEAPDGSSLAATDSAARFIERVLGRHAAVRAVFTNVGRDNPQIYYNIIPRHENPAVGQLFVLLRDYDPERTPRMLDTLRRELAGYPGAQIRVRALENGPPIDAPIALRLSGPDLDTLRTLAARVEGVLRSTPGTIYVNNPIRTRGIDLEVAIERQRAGLLGIPTVDAERAIRMGLAGLTAGSYRTRDGEDYDITVRLPRPGMATPATLNGIYLASLSGAQVPLRQVTDVRLAASAPSIQHFDRERTTTLTAYVRSGYNTDRVTKAVLARLDSLSLPQSYRISAAGEIESRQESFGGVGTAMIVAVFLILAILVLEFRTFRSTLIVASVIPLGIVGGIVALWLSGYTLSFTATIGFVALVGIEIKTSILLVDFTNQLRAQGVPLGEAVQRAGEVRFVPIVLTTLTAIGGLLPLALEGSGFYSPLAWVIIGGLVSSTLLSRLVTPVMYKLLPPAVETSAAAGGV
ncbi:MAG: efflux RND transporter permease subunit [Gemmatimonadetes bacterium]|nr:efflux RND transporter permease subunit [Gemmatimonadota bacterium]